MSPVRLIVASGANMLDAVFHRYGQPIEDGNCNYTKAAGIGGINQNVDVSVS